MRERRFFGDFFREIDIRRDLLLWTGGEMKLISLKSDYAFKELFSYANVRKQFLSDVLGIPLEEIREVRVTTPFLWKRRARQKQGILDMALELNGKSKVNVEMQVRRQSAWTKRELFYLAKMYTEDLKSGQDYERLCRCVSIGLLDFDLTEGEKYHSVYRLREADGRELTDLLEVHIVELSKTLQGTEAVDDWIRLFNAKSEEDLEMIRAENAGIREAVGVIKEMSLRKSLRYLYEEHLKRIRDRRGEDAYIRNQGKEEGKIEGKIEGKAEDILLLLGEVGSVPQEVSDQIVSEKDPDILKDWLKAAARAEDVRQFREECGI